MNTAPTVALSAEDLSRALADPAAKKKRRDAAAASSDQARRMTGAASAALPGPLRAAFAGARRELLGFQLAPITAAHIAILQEIDNPVYLQLLHTDLIIRAGKDEKGKELPRGKAMASRKKMAALLKTPRVKIPDIAEMFWIFTLEKPEYAETLLTRRNGRQLLRQTALAAMLGVGGIPPVADWRPIVEALGAHYTLSLVTAVAYRAQAPPGDGGEDFTKPAPPTTTATGAAG